ncbi:arsenate reductase [Longispora fulva]|uniref:Arsenate reductase n=1 Tax=Longispora fulva TaxID=619741 RepID=A0A8J7GKT8_9ACTN|nr:ArsC/Spx/MgsR family protein [Longispora fulva]MBG6141444.1 arsenate reductase [Longispora fulva]GIG59406.1 arsenate reductase [Longispora fulva]
MEIWNNPSCSKCAAARDTLSEAGVPFTLRGYLDLPPTVAELGAVLDRLGAQPWDVCRTGEAAYTVLDMADWTRDEDNRGRWLAAMVAHPVLIQRPIVLLDDGSAVVARDRETLDRLIAAT